MTHKQQLILRFVSSKDTVTKAEIVEQFKRWYFCNAEKHIGDILARMVSAKLLSRVKPGVYSLYRPVEVGELGGLFEGN